MIFFWRLTLIGSLYGFGYDWLFLFLIQSVLDAQWLAYQVQMYYASESDRREEILKTFNILIYSSHAYQINAQAQNFRLSGCS